MLSYRLPVLAGLARSPDWDVTAFHGPAPEGFRAVAAATALPIPVRQVRHRFWPDGKRMVWTGGTWSVLSGTHDVAVLEFCVHNAGVWLLWLARRLMGRPRIVLSGHFRLTDREHGWPAALRRRLKLLLARGADALLPYTPGGRQDCLAHGLAQDRIFVTCNTVDVGSARRAAAGVGPEDAAALRRRLDLPAGPVFLYVGSLYPEKRLDLAIAAVTLLRRRGRGATLVIVGDGRLRDEMARIASNNPAVRLLPAEADDEKLAPLFKLATAVICPASVGLLITHSFAFGVPLVTCGGVPHGVEIDYLRPGHNGLLVEIPSAEAVADGLAELLDRPGLLQRLRDGAQETADHMTIDSIIEANIAAYGRALADPPAGGVR